MPSRQKSNVQSQAPQGPPTEGEQTGRQGIMWPGVVGFDGPVFSSYGTIGSSGTALSSPWASFAAGTGFDNPCGFPFWGSGYWGTYSTYRFMLSHYRVQHVRANVLNSLLDASWEIKINDKSVPKKWVEVIEQLMKLRREYLEDAYNAVDFGWQGFEKIWEIVNDRYYVQRLKPLIHDTTRILTDAAGNFIGLHQAMVTNSRAQVGISITDKEPLYGLNKYKAAIVTNTKYGTNWYGRSRLENLRSTAWVNWLDIAQQLNRLGVKVTGFQPIVKVPAGNYEEGGQVISYRQNAKDAIKDLVHGQGVVITNLALNRVGANGSRQHMSDPELLAKLAQASLIDLDVLDFGTLTPAIEGLLKRLIHAENGMAEGYLHSPREIAESEKGSKADAERHTETGELDPMTVASSIDLYTNRYIVDDLLELIGGVKARGTIELFTPAIKTAKVAQARNLLNTMIQSNHILGEKIADALGDDGMGQLFADANLKSSKKWSEAESVTETMGKSDNSKGNFEPKDPSGGNANDNADPKQPDQPPQPQPSPAKDKSGNNP